MSKTTSRDTIPSVTIITSSDSGNNIAHNGQQIDVYFVAITNQIEYSHKYDRQKDDTDYLEKNHFILEEHNHKTHTMCH